MRILPVLALSSILSISGCAAAQRQFQPSVKVVAASAQSQPRWLAAKTSEESGYLYFVGRADGVKDLSTGERQAEVQARSVIRGELREHLRREFEQGHGRALDGKREALDQALSTQLSELSLEGLTPVERYWERLEVPVDDGTTYAYRLALRVRIAKDRFEATRAQAYRRVATQVGI